MPSKLNVCHEPACRGFCGKRLAADVGASDAILAHYNVHRVWPTERQYMADTIMISMRMSEDALELIRERGIDAVVTVDDLLEQGWIYDQVRRFGDAAIALVQSEIASRANVA